MASQERLLEFRRGQSRWVVLIWRYAVKVPRCSRRRHPGDGPSPTYRKRIRQGRNCNLAERRAWHARQFPHLCPILFADRFGWVVVMLRAAQITDAEFDEWEASPDWPHVPFIPTPYELKADDAGRLPDGRLVMIDYGMRGYQVDLHTGGV